MDPTAGVLVNEGSTGSVALQETMVIGRENSWTCIRGQTVVWSDDTEYCCQIGSPKVGEAVRTLLPT